MIEGTARGLATDKNVSEEEAVRKLRTLAISRADLLAEAAGVSLGFSGGDPTSGRCTGLASCVSRLERIRTSLSLGWLSANTVPS